MAKETRIFGVRQRRPAEALKPFPLREPLQRMLERGKTELAAPFKGVTTGGTMRSGLFPLMKTDRSLASVAEAAQNFLAVLDPAQRAAVSFDLESEPWRAWHNMHPFMIRHGLLLHELSEAQREAGLDLLRASLSAAGVQTARDVMRLNEHIGEITGKPVEYGEWYYWMSVMGTPSSNAPWGWQIDSHHLIVNCLVLGDQIVLTPNFLGSEPIEAKSGKYAGTRVFGAEEVQGFALMSALSAEQRQKATIGMTLPFDVYATAFNDNLVMPYQGLHYDEMSAMQRDELKKLIDIYVGRIRPNHAAVKRNGIERHLGEIHFAWIDACNEESPFYYRIHSPVILIEFDHQPGIALDNDEPTRNHIHTLVPTPHGNDYGKNLLRQYYAQFDHSRPDTPHRRGKI